MGIVQNTLRRLGYVRREAGALWPYTEDAADSRAWKRLGQGAYKFDRDVPSQFLQESIQRAFRAWRLNPFVKRITEMHVNYVVGDGVTISAGDERVQAVCESFWNDPNNTLDLKLEEVVRDLSLFGEVYILPFVNVLTGRVNLGYLDPLSVQAIESNPLNYNEPVYVCVNAADGTQRKLRIVYLDKSGNAKDAIPHVYGKANEALNIPVSTVGMHVGEAFYLAANKTIGVTRGTGDFLPILDWCRSTEDLLFTQLEKAQLQNAVYLMVTVAGASPEELQRYRTPGDTFYLPMPKPGSMGIKNDKMTYEYLAPTLNSGDMAEAVRMFKSMIEIGSGVPEHQFGQGGDVNRATALEMGGPFHKMLLQRQRQVKYALEDVLQFVIDQKRIFTHDLDGVSDFSVSVTMSPINAKDTATEAATTNQMLSAIVAAKQSKLISDELAFKLGQQVLANAGLEFEQESYNPQPQAPGNGYTPPSPGLLEAMKRFG